MSEPIDNRAPANRRAVLRSILAAGVIASVSAAGASATPVQSEALRIAIAAHKAAQAKVDGMVTPSDPLAVDDYEDAFNSACHDAEAALWEVAEAQCLSDADFFVKGRPTSSRMCAASCATCLRTTASSASWRSLLRCTLSSERGVK